MADSFIPGGDFIPGSDNIPSVSDVLGIDPFGSDPGSTFSPTDTTGGPTNIGGAGTDPSAIASESGGGGWTPPTGSDPVSAAARNIATTAGNTAAKNFLTSMLGNAASTIGHAITGATGTTGTTGNTTGVGAQSQTPNNLSSNRINLTPGLTQATSIPASELGGVFSAIPSIMGSAPVNFGAYAEGHRVKEEHHSSDEHVPEFYSEGGLKHRYVQGDGDGTSDSVPAMLANGEFVIPADVVSSLGNGSNDSGSKVLDEFMKVIREHKSKHDADKLPPDSKGPLAYLEISKTKVEK